VHQVIWTFISAPSPWVLTKETTYMFSITTQNGNTYFTVIRPNIVWSLTAPTGGNYLVLQNTIRILWTIQTMKKSGLYRSQAAPNFQLYFPIIVGPPQLMYQLCRMGHIFGGQPSNVGVAINGNSVFVKTILTLFSGITCNSGCISSY